MPLAPDNVLPYLIERGLLSPQDALGPDIAILDQSSRNRNLRVTRAAGGFFIKQPRDDADTDGWRSLAREAACYRLAHADDRFGALRELMPRFHRHDLRLHILVLEDLGDARSVWEHERAAGAFSPDVAARLGAALGACHAHVRVDGLPPDILALFDRRPPWVLSVHEMDPAMVATTTPAGAQVVSIVRRQSVFAESFARLAGSWRHDALIHGDMKWENCMLVRPPSDETPRVRIIDWELADVGDACWDVGSIMQSYISYWIVSLGLGRGVDPARAASITGHRPEQITPALSAFWRAYAGARALPANRAGAELERCMTCAAARMVQTAYEVVHQLPQVSQHAIVQLQFSMNMLLDPARAARDFVGAAEVHP